MRSLLAAAIAVILGLSSCTSTSETSGTPDPASARVQSIAEIDGIGVPSPDGRHIASLESGELCVLTLESNDETCTAAELTGALAWSPGGTAVLINGRNFLRGGEVFTIDGSTTARTLVEPENAVFLAWASDDEIYFTDASGVVSVNVSTQSQEVVHDTPVAQLGSALATGDTVWWSVPTSNNSQVSALSLDDGATIEFASDEDFDWYVEALARDGDVALVIDLRALRFLQLGTERPRLGIADRTTGEFIEIFAPNDQQSIVAATISPDGSLVVAEVATRRSSDVELLATTIDYEAGTAGEWKSLLTRDDDGPLLALPSLHSTVWTSPTEVVTVTLPGSVHTIALR